MKRKRRVKYYRRVKSGKVYQHPWIGYSYRNKNGTPDFKREVSLVGIDEQQVKAIERALRGGDKTVVSSQFNFLGGQAIGASWTAHCIATELGIINELESFEDKHRMALTAMILDRVVTPLPHSKLGLWETLPESGIERVVAPEGMQAELHDFYSALEKIHEKQNKIQKALFGNSQRVDRMFLYDITSSYMEGTECPLSMFGYNRDGKKGKMQIVIGLLTHSDGRPIAVEVFEGNTSDQTTVMERIDTMRTDFRINEMIFIGDRGMVTKARRNDLEKEQYSKVNYISALTRKEFHQFIEDQSHPIQLGIFDREKLVEVQDEGVRYILSFNPEKEEEDREIRLRLVEKTKEKLQMIERNVKNGRWKSSKVIAKRLFSWVNKWKMERFFNYEYDDGKFTFELNEERLKAYKAIDGFYVITTDVIESELQTSEVRERYKSLSHVEQAFRALKTTDLFMRPIRHWNPERVKGHIFMCMLAYLIVWKARNLFSAFITHEQVLDEKPRPDDDCHSLRVLWERLDRWVQIGKFQIGGKITEQLNVLPPKAKPILKAANALPTPKKLERLELVG